MTLTLATLNKKLTELYKKAENSLNLIVVERYDNENKKNEIIANYKQKEGNYTLIMIKLCD